MATNPKAVPGDGVTTVITYPHQVYDVRDLVICLSDVVTGEVEKLQVDKVVPDYAVSGVGDPAGVTITLVDAIPVGKTACVQRRATIEPVADLRERHRILDLVEDFLAAGATGGSIGLLSVADIGDPTELAAIEGRASPPSLILAYQDGATGQNDATLFIWDPRAGLAALQSFVVPYGAGDGGWVAIAGARAIHGSNQFVGTLVNFGPENNPAVVYFARRNNPTGLTAGGGDIGTFGFLDDATGSQTFVGGLTLKNGSIPGYTETAFVVSGPRGLIPCAAYKEDGSTGLAWSTVVGGHGAFVTKEGGLATPMKWNVGATAAYGPAGATPGVHGMLVEPDPGVPNSVIPCQLGGNAIGVLYIDAIRNTNIPPANGDAVWIVRSGDCDVLENAGFPAGAAGDYGFAPTAGVGTIGQAEFNAAAPAAVAALLSKFGRAVVNASTGGLVRTSVSFN